MQKYTPSHEWILMNQNEGTVGITRYAQGELGEIVYVEVPLIGKEFCMGQESAVLESTKAAADVYVPVTGVVTAVNEALVLNPSLLNKDPEGAGWIFKIHVQDLKQLDDLLEEKEYIAMIQA